MTVNIHYCYGRPERGNLLMPLKEQLLYHSDNIHFLQTTVPTHTHKLHSTHSCSMWSCWVIPLALWLLCLHIFRSQFCGCSGQILMEVYIPDSGPGLPHGGHVSGNRTIAVGSPASWTHSTDPSAVAALQASSTNGTNTTVTVTRNQNQCPKGSLWP